MSMTIQIHILLQQFIAVFTAESGRSHVLFCSIAGGAQGQVGWGHGQPELEGRQPMAGVEAGGRGVTTNPTMQWFYDCVTKSCSDKGGKTDAVL